MLMWNDVQLMDSVKFCVLAARILHTECALSSQAVPLSLTLIYQALYFIFLRQVSLYNTGWIGSPM